MQDHQQTWETYAGAWKVKTAAEKRELFAKSLAPECQYHDPLILTKGWDDLEAYMLDFHKQIPGGHFVTKYFLAHGNQSIARWEMCNAEDAVLGDGISHGEYNNSGKLISLTGFFEPPSVE